MRPGSCPGNVRVAVEADQPVTGLKAAGRGAHRVNAGDVPLAVTGFLVPPERLRSAACEQEPDSVREGGNHDRRGETNDPEERMPPAARHFFGRVWLQRGRLFPRRVVEQATARDVLREQRLDLPQEFFILPANFGKIRGSLRGLPLASPVVQILDLPPALGVHGPPPPPGLYNKRAKTEDQSKRALPGTLI